MHCEYIFKCFLTVGRNKWRIDIHELFDFGLCCMESFSSLASIRKLLKFVAALSKYMYMISLMILFTQAMFPCYHDIKNNLCKMRYGYKQICNAFWGLKKYCNKDIKYDRRFLSIMYTKRINASIV